MQQPLARLGNNVYKESKTKLNPIPLSATIYILATCIPAEEESNSCTHFFVRMLGKLLDMPLMPVLLLDACI